MTHDPVKFTGVLSDWRMSEGPGAAESLTDAQKKPWAFDITISKTTIHVALTAPDLTLRFAVLEIDAGEAVLRGYLSEQVMDEPVSLRLKAEQIEITLPSKQNAEHVAITP